MITFGERSSKINATDSQIKTNISKISLIQNFHFFLNYSDSKSNLV
jgi:hypothetical protein